MPRPNMAISLTFIHLRFDLIARTAIKLGQYQAGERLRGALGQVMLRAVCPVLLRSEKPAPEHTATCPVCWLLAAETDPGEVRRAYALVPPLPPLEVVETGQRFSFTLTLFGDGFQYMPYFVLAVPEIGRTGIGPGRGKFDLQAIYAANPLAGEVEAVLKPGEKLVRVPQRKVGWIDVQTAASRLIPGLQDGANLQLRFLTPTRLVEDGILVKVPDFGVFFRRLLLRIDQLSQQHTAEKDRRAPEEVERLHSLADRVRLVEADTPWVDIKSSSRRTKRSAPMGGFIGLAVYRSKHWDELLPWLILGQGTQAGKLTVKGNGVFEISMPGVQRYWSHYAPE